VDVASTPPPTTGITAVLVRTPSTESVPSDTTPASSGPAFDVTMHRSGCFGRCPSYSVTILADGAVAFSGERFVGATGPQKGQADPSKLKALQALLADPAFANLSGEYTPANPKNCGRWATDAASVSITIGSAPFPRTISHYLGCEGAPAGLRVLEKAIDDAAAVSRWINSESSQ